MKKILVIAGICPAIGIVTAEASSGLYHMIDNDELFLCWHILLLMLLFFLNIYE
jgi:hypothetical protein